MKVIKDLDATIQKPNPRRPRNPSDKYIVISLNMVDVDDRTIIIVKLQHLKKGNYVFRTPEEIVGDHKFAFSLSKKDLMQVSYLAGFHQTIH